MKKIEITIFSIILILAIFLRVFRLDSLPPALFGDEIDVGYQAYSLLKTGKDLSGNFMPLYIQSLSEHRTPLYLYSAVPFVALFGLNEWGVRLPAAFWGVISVIGIFLLSRKLFNTKAALITMFLLAVSPWHLQYSRASFEVTMLITFIIYGLYFFLLGLSKNRYLFLSAALLLSSIYIYSTAVVFVPLLSLLILSIYWRQIFKLSPKIIAFVLLVSVILVLPFTISYFSGESKARFSSISIFQDSVLEDKINLARKAQDFYSPEGQTIPSNPQIERFFHNRPTIFIQVFLKNYFQSISPLFIFADGDINFRHSIHEMGEQYYAEFVLFVLGIFALIKLDPKKSALIFGWFLIAPIPSALTSDGGSHATRLFIMLPAVTLVTGLGGEWIINNFKNIYIKLFAVLVIIIFLFNFVFYIHRYYVHYGPESWRWWHVGFKEAMLYMKSEENNYNLIGFNNTYEPSLIRFLFWNKINPADFQKNHSQILEKSELFPNYTGFKYTDKYFFGGIEQGKEITQSLPAGVLYMVSARDEVPGDWDWSKDPPSGIKVLETIYDPTGLPIFYVITKN